MLRSFRRSAIESVQEHGVCSYTRLVIVHVDHPCFFRDLFPRRFVARLTAPVLIRNLRIRKLGT
jgi:hypothetical protein